MGQNAIRYTASTCSIAPLSARNGSLCCISTAIWALPWIGQLFIKLLKMIIVPLVLTSIISGVASVGGSAGLGRLFGKTLGYYVFTSFLAVITGLVLANTLQPGVGADIAGAETHELPNLTVVTSPVQLVYLCTSQDAQ